MNDDEELNNHAKLNNDDARRMKWKKQVLEEERARKMRSRETSSDYSTGQRKYIFDSNSLAVTE